VVGRTGSDFREVLSLQWVVRIGVAETWPEGCGRRKIDNGQLARLQAATCRMIIDIDPKVDFVFKYLLGRESTRPILVSVLDSVLAPPPDGRVGYVDVLNPYNPKEALDDKLSILDIKARDQSGRLFNVEMQMLTYRYYEKRILYYASRLHQGQLHEGEDYLKLRPTISISFLNHVLFANVPGYHLVFRLLEETHHFPFTKDLELHILELPKFTKSATELSTELDIWLYFLRHVEKMDRDALPAALEKHPLVRRAVEELIVLAQTDLERERYEARRKAQLDFNTGLKVARMEGVEEGLQQGLQKGRIQGEVIGGIHLCERWLNRPETPIEQLAGLAPEEIGRLLETLQAEVFSQRR
jgi:predicted transposase/invertase (TIGR01784 family)